MFFKNVEDAFLMSFCSKNNPQNHSKIDKKLIKNRSKNASRKMIEISSKMPPQEEGLAPKTAVCQRLPTRPVVLRTIYPKGA